MSEQSGEGRGERVHTAIVHGRWTGYRMLLRARLKEMFREPEVIFWIFFFPILLALGLGSQRWDCRGRVSKTKC